MVHRRGLIVSSQRHARGVRRHRRLKSSQHELSSCKWSAVSVERQHRSTFQLNLGCQEKPNASASSDNACVIFRDQQEKDVRWSPFDRLGCQTSTRTTPVIETTGVSKSVALVSKDLLVCGSQLWGLKPLTNTHKHGRV